MAFFVFVKEGKRRRRSLRESEIGKKVLSEVVCLVNKTNGFHAAVRLFSNRSQKTSKCGKNISHFFFALITF